MIYILKYYRTAVNSLIACRNFWSGENGKIFSIERPSRGRIHGFTDKGPVKKVLADEPSIPKITNVARFGLLFTEFYTWF